MKIDKISILYYVDNQLEEITISEPNSYESANIHVISNVLKENSGDIFTLRIIPKKKIKLKSLSMYSKMELYNQKMMVNGFQSWTESREMNSTSIIRRLNPLLKKFLCPYGDYSFYKYTGKKGVLHSFTYTYFKNGENEVFFIGSIDEKTGYTIFETNYKNNSLKIIKDCDGLVINDECEILRLFESKSGLRKSFNEYFSHFKNKRNKVSNCTGWTSWYNYYTNISEEIALKNLHALNKEKIPIDYFQIDDGYQESVGDWLCVNKKFPSGMKALACKIKAAGYKPGIWLAPFICERKSRIFKEHPQWILKNHMGKLVKAGINPGWSGTFYALDFYNHEVREYLKNVFETILHHWGYDIVKLDFLYAVGIIPRKGKSRGQIMCEAMEFLSNIIGDKKILGCGVPLGPSFKLVDYCRIGADVAPYWEDKKLKFSGYRERVSTINSLHSTIGRSTLNKHAFLNDPDVFILRKQDNKLTYNQKFTLFILNNLLGSLVFFSDYIEEYGDIEMNMFKSMFPSVEPIIKNVTEDNSMYRIYFKVCDKNYVIFSNLTGTKRNIKLHEGRYYNRKDFIIEGNKNIILEPYESKCFYIIEGNHDIQFVGSSGHLFPGCEIEKLNINNNEIKLEISKHMIKDTEIFFEVNINIKNLAVNGKEYLVEKIGTHNIVKITKSHVG